MTSIIWKSLAWGAGEVNMQLWENLAEWCKLSIMSIFPEGWDNRKELPANVQTSCRVFRLIFCLEKGFSSIPIDKRVWNIVSISYEWKSALGRTLMQPRVPYLGIQDPSWKIQINIGCRNHYISLILNVHITTKITV